MWRDLKMSEHEDDDHWVENQLGLWGLKYLYSNFKDEGIDRETLLTMPPEAVKEVIPKLGPRCTYLRKRQEFNQKINELGQALQGTASTMSVDSSIDDFYDRHSSAKASYPNTVPAYADSEKSATSVASTSSRRVSGQHIKNLLAQSVTGQALLKTIRFTDRNRHKLAGIVIDHELNKDLKIITETLDFWASEIEKAFEFERKPMYFVAYKSAIKKSASGKLWDKYTNLIL